MPTFAKTLAIGETAPDLPVLNQLGESISLAPFWQTSTNGAAVVFLRHFGCLFCREHAVRLRKAYDEFTTRELALVTIGLGSAEDARGFAEWLKLPYPVLAATNTAIYEAWGLGKTTGADMFKPALVKAGVRALTQRVSQGRPTGDGKQLPGSFLVSNDSIVRWSHVATHPGDIASIESVLTAADALIARRSA
jgi:peroxiredoxin